VSTTGPLPSRDDNATMTPGPERLACPVCSAPFTRIGRQTYCNTACRKVAFRRRHNTLVRPTVPAGVARREVSAYQCNTCGERQLGEQRCETCNTFGQALGLAGNCPHCDSVIAAADLDRTS